jgi:hypothetical protein
MIEGAVDEAVRNAVRIREHVEDAEVRFGERESAERRRKGWRSQAFDC